MTKRFSRGIADGSVSFVLFHVVPRRAKSAYRINMASDAARLAELNGLKKTKLLQQKEKARIFNEALTDSVSLL